MRRLLALGTAGLAISLSQFQAGGSAVASSVPPAGSNEVHVYVNGLTYHMTINHVNLDPSAEEIAAASPFYVAVFPLNPDGRADLGQLTVGGGYQPQCDPCFHPGLPLELIYHDHILSGAPGFGNDGTAQMQQGTRHPIAVMYNPAIIQRTDFRPLTRAADVEAAEQAGELLPINPTAANPFELPQNAVVTVQLVPISR